MSIVKINSLGITNPVSFSAGTEALPSITFSGDTNTGVFAPAADTIGFTEGGTEAMRIDSSGRVLIGNTSSYLGSRLLINSTGTDANTNILTLRNSSSTDYFRVRSDGYTYAQGIYNNTTASGANTFVGSNGDFLRSTSSLKYKKEVQDATHGLSKVLQLRSVTYKGINDGEKIFGGLIAEEVHDVGLTEFVQYAEDGSPDALAYGNMVSLCIKSIQELSAKVDIQQTKIEQLEARLTALES